MFFSEFVCSQLEWVMLKRYIVRTPIFHVIKSLKNIKFLNNS